MFRLFNYPGCAETHKTLIHCNGKIILKHPHSLQVLKVGGCTLTNFHNEIQNIFKKKEECK